MKYMIQQAHTCIYGSMRVNISRFTAPDTARLHELRKRTFVGKQKMHYCVKEAKRVEEKPAPTSQKLF
jgi:hypothetical protein